MKAHAKDKTPEGIYGLWGNVAEYVGSGLSGRSWGDTRWMGPSFKRYPMKEEGMFPFTPRNDWWGYVHNAESRKEDLGFRVLLELPAAHNKNGAANGSQPFRPEINSFSFAAVADDTPSVPRMSLSNRVAEATLIVVGKLGPPGNTGRHVTTSLQVEQVLFGSIPTNKTLFVSYSGTAWLIPDLVSRTDPPKRGSRWIIFLTDQGVTQRESTNYYTCAVGRHKYAHDGFELTKEETLKQVREMIAQKQR